MTCHDFDQSLALYLYDELSNEERSAIELHIASCEQCKRALEQSRSLVNLIHEHTPAEPAPDLLVHCRQRLEESLDREQMGWRSLLRAWLPPAAAAHPARAATALTLVALGFSLGWVVRPRVGTLLPRPQATAPVAGSQMAGSELGGARINSISQVAPDPETGKVQITLNAEKRVTMEGSLDNPRIRDVMVYALKSYDNPGIRLDTLNALGNDSGDPTVRDALLYALEHDTNAGVRLAALRTVSKDSWNDDVSHAFLAAAERDQNLGVREAAIDELVSHVNAAGEDEGDDDMVPALQHLAAQDTDRYVRTKSIEALRQMGQPLF